jgi:hypothetical protein
MVLVSLREVRPYANWVSGTGRGSFRCAQAEGSLAHRRNVALSGISHELICRAAWAFLLGRTSRLVMDLL